MTIRTRIAPSPTGFPHIGTIYQALFDYTYAKKHNGQFLVRIEDTDKARFVEGAEESIYEALDWFGLQEDESPRKGGEYAPYRQSERLELYKQYAEELVEKGYAYYCMYTAEELEQFRQEKREKKLPPVINDILRSQNLQKKDLVTGKYVIRMKIPGNETIVIKDQIRGEISFDSNLIDDQVILKSDGFPTYHLAVVVDDHLMQITHVLRGEEWINSTPKHVLLYRYFNWEAPKFYHSALLRNPDKSKMSKRHGHASVSWYKEKGFLPQAILNYLSLMAWSHPEGKEKFTLDEFIQVFDFDNLRAVGPAFDLKKLEWLNGEYIRELDNETLTHLLASFYNNSFQEDILQASVPLIKERIKTLSDYLPLTEFLYKAPEEYEIVLEDKKELLQKTSEKLKKVISWKAEAIGEAMQEVAQELGIKNSDYFMIMRVAISGKKISPPLNESMELLGQEECISRINKIV